VVVLSAELREQIPQILDHQVRIIVAFVEPVAVTRRSTNQPTSQTIN
jgi:hypothetical protein